MAVKLCAKCRVRERHVFSTGTVYAYCSKCRVDDIASRRKTVNHSMVTLRKLASYPKNREG